MVAWAINEFPLGARPAAFMYMAGPVMANILDHIGSEQQRHWAAITFQRNWGATMVLTEPDAGSDVGAGRTKAIQQPTAPGISTASSDSSPTAIPTTCSRTTCT